MQVLLQANPFEAAQLEVELYDMSWGFIVTNSDNWLCAFNRKCASKHSFSECLAQEPRTFRCLQEERTEEAKKRSNAQLSCSQ